MIRTLDVVYSYSQLSRTNRYCVFDPKTMLFSSYKVQPDDDTRALSQHTIKISGEWTGKGNFHKYPHAFVIETMTSKVFHCSAPTAEEKQNWLVALAGNTTIEEAHGPISPRSSSTSFLAEHQSERSIQIHTEEVQQEAEPEKKGSDLQLFQSPRNDDSRGSDWGIFNSDAQLYVADDEDPSQLLLEADLFDTGDVTSMPMYEEVFDSVHSTIESFGQIKIDTIEDNQSARTSIAEEREAAPQPRSDIKRTQNQVDYRELSKNRIQNMRKDVKKKKKSKHKREKAIEEDEISMDEREKMYSESIKRFQNQSAPDSSTLVLHEEKDLLQQQLSPSKYEQSKSFHDHSPAQKEERKIEEQPRYPYHMNPPQQLPYGHNNHNGGYTSQQAPPSSGSRPHDNTMHGHSLPAAALPPHGYYPPPYYPPPHGYHHGYYPPYPYPPAYPYQQPHPPSSSPSQPYPYPNYQPPIIKHSHDDAIQRPSQSEPRKKSSKKSKRRPKVEENAMEEISRGRKEKKNKKKNKSLERRDSYSPPAPELRSSSLDLKKKKKKSKKPTGGRNEETATPTPYGPALPSSLALYQQPLVTTPSTFGEVLLPDVSRF